MHYFHNFGTCDFQQNKLMAHLVIAHMELDVTNTPTET